MPPVKGEARYPKERQLGQGTYGIVYKAHDVNKEESDKNYYVAIKKMRMTNSKEGVPIPALREIKLLQEVNHPNVIRRPNTEYWHLSPQQRLLDVFASKNNLNMVLELGLADFEDIVRDRSIPIAPDEIKSCLKMILEGVDALHQKWILHRDLKPGNILVGTDGNLKITDFGLGRMHGSPNAILSNNVITRWYRPPELLYATRSYGPAVDVWSIGCIFAELMLRSPYLPGMSDIDQLAKIFQARGTPNKEDWPDHDTLPAYVEFSDSPIPDHSQVFFAASPQALDLMNQMLQLNPNKRISTEDALKHPFFTEEEPAPCSPAALLEKFKIGQVLNDKNDSQNGDAIQENEVSDRAKALGSRRLSFS